MRLNTPIAGFIIGLLLPVLGMFIMYLIWGGHQGVGDFAAALTHQRGMAAKVVLLGVLINLVPFVYFNLKRLDEGMRGVFIATMIYAVFVVLIKFVW